MHEQETKPKEASVGGAHGTTPAEGIQNACARFCFNFTLISLHTSTVPPSQITVWLRDDIIRLNKVDAYLNSYIKDMATNTNRTTTSRAAFRNKPIYLSALAPTNNKNMNIVVGGAARVRTHRNDYGSEDGVRSRREQAAWSGVARRRRKLGYHCCVRARHNSLITGDWSLRAAAAPLAHSPHSTDRRKAIARQLEPLPSRSAAKYSSAALNGALRKPKKTFGWNYHVYSTGKIDTDQRHTIILTTWTRPRGIRNVGLIYQKRGKE
ncbi:unnamed protein product [Leptidea sinapis]|uniref:Uncharacterized protein n=1 Tax=Leptidea sinapis TaxID=189913 RepID=A0A5E4QVF9_9NEOP|nr:unnamed protein product [Leptidea sinapis]